MRQFKYLEKNDFEISLTFPDSVKKECLSSFQRKQKHLEKSIKFILYFDMQ